MASEAHDVVVLGAGISGLVAVKSCVDAGLSTVAVEQSGEVGGLWRYRDRVPYGVMDFTHINVSRFNYHFSDFPVSESGAASDAAYLSHQEMAAYIDAYTQKHRLLDHIQFNTTVVRVHRDADGMWNVDVERENGDQATLRAANVAVASGHQCV